MQHITDTPAMPLWNTSTTRQLEQALAARLPPHTLMVRAGQAIARLSQALAPHAKRIWIACGPGNNGGDGLLAFVFLKPWADVAGIELLVTWSGTFEKRPPDAQYAWKCAQDAGITFASEATGRFDLVIDALLGIGHRTDNSPSPQLHQMQRWKQQMGHCADLILNVDLPSGLNGDTGWISPEWARQRLVPTVTLTFLTLKPGLFSAQGRDEAGEVWLDELGLHQHPDVTSAIPARGWLGHPQIETVNAQAAKIWHQSHKGSFGDVWVLGGQQPSSNTTGMVGAAILAGKAALHAGAGRVHLLTLGPQQPFFDPVQPEFMFKDPDKVFNQGSLPNGVWVCGCGGGEAIQAYLAPLLNTPNTIVLDADALNWIAKNPALEKRLMERHLQNKMSVITPHPLEAARLLQCSTQDIMKDRIQAAITLAQKLNAICVLKGSGTVIATSTGMVSINPTGSGRLATAGTGDVLAGCIGGHLSRHATSLIPLDTLVCRSVFLHGETERLHPKLLSASLISNSLSP